MIQFRDEAQCKISVRHYMNTFKSKLILCDATAHDITWSGLLITLNHERFDQAKKYLKTIQTTATDGIQEVETALNKDFVKHAQTVKAHTQFVTRWEGKVGQISMEILRNTTALEELFAPLETDEPELIKTMNEVKMKLLSIKAALITLPNSADFIEQSSTRRSEKLAEIVNSSGLVTLCALTNVVKVGQWGKVSFLRELIKHRLVKALPESVTVDMIEANEGIVPVNAVKSLVIDVIDATKEETRTEVLASVRSLLTDDGGGELGLFIKRVVTPAIDNAFSPDSKKVSCVVCNIPDIVKDYLETELGCKTDKLDFMP